LIGRMLHGMPTRPVLVIVPIVMALVIALYYAEKHAECTRNTELRERLYALAEDRLGASLSLNEILETDWEHAAILIGFRPEAGSKLPDCPFDWGWTKADRQSLAGRGLLNVIALTRDNRVIDYIEFRRDRIDFTGLDNPYTPEEAVFQVSGGGSVGGKLLLRPVVAGD